MKYKHILVTGGAGFIGSHLVDALVEKGYIVRVLDNLDPQVHPSKKLPTYFNTRAEFIQGDVRNRKDWEKALKNIDAVFHFASAVGVGQSMYKIEHYVQVNSYGTALLLDILANNKHTVKKIISTASMTSYGEGAYRCKTHSIVRPALRTKVSGNQWEPRCPQCNKDISPIPISEDADLNGNSIYAVSKNNQEQMMMVFAKAYQLPVVSLRFFNVYGTRQSLSNPYTGVAAIFMSRIKNNHKPLINEDGLQSRDFIHVYDVVSACITSLEKPDADYHIFNVASGTPTTIKQLAHTLIQLSDASVLPNITKKFRTMDIRHCTGDITQIKKKLSWKPEITLDRGLKELIHWGETEKADDHVEKALQELAIRGLQ